MLYEFIHVVTDGRRFAIPLEMSEALSQADRIWKARETRQIHPTPGVLPLSLDLMRNLKLGRKRILDTVLAATFQVHGVSRVLTLDAAGFGIFPFLEVVAP